VKDPDAIDGEILKEVIVDLLGNNKEFIDSLMNNIPNMEAVQEELKLVT